VPQVERPDEVNDLLTQFFARAEQAGWSPDLLEPGAQAA
jgi:hypothetical protein